MDGENFDATVFELPQLAMQRGGREVARILCQLRERVREGSLDEQRVDAWRAVDEPPELLCFRRVRAEGQGGLSVGDDHADGRDDVVNVDGRDLEVRDLELDADLEGHILHHWPALVPQL